MPHIYGVTPDAFPAEAGPTKSMSSVCGIGFSREEASVNTIDFRCETRRIPG